jgi:hypothetical protein
MIVYAYYAHALANRKGVWKATDEDQRGAISEPISRKMNATLIISCCFEFSPLFHTLFFKYL